MEAFVGIALSICAAATPLLVAALGEVVVERSHLAGHGALEEPEVGHEAIGHVVDFSQLTRLSPFRRVSVSRKLDSKSSLPYLGHVNNS